MPAVARRAPSELPASSADGQGSVLCDDAPETDGRHRVAVPSQLCGSQRAILLQLGEGEPRRPAESAFRRTLHRNARSSPPPVAKRPVAAWPATAYTCQGWSQGCAGLAAAGAPARSALANTVPTGPAPEALTKPRHQPPRPCPSQKLAAGHRCPGPPPRPRPPRPGTRCRSARLLSVEQKRQAQAHRVRCVLVQEVVGHGRRTT